MNRRSILRLLGLAPVVAPLAMAAAARAATGAAPLTRAYGVGESNQAVAQRTTALEALARRVTRTEGNIVSLTSGPNTLTA